MHAEFAHFKAVHVFQYRWERLNKKYKTEATFKNPFAICDPGTHKAYPIPLTTQ
jgi:hypothetical protein